MPRLPFAKSQQLTHDREYQRVYAARTSVVRGPLRVSAVANGETRSRLGLSVPKRVGTNVKRNRIKRLIREAFRLNQHAVPPGLDIVVGVHPHDERTLEGYAQLLLSAAETLASKVRRGEAGMAADKRRSSEQTRHG